MFSTLTHIPHLIPCSMFQMFFIYVLGCLPCDVKYLQPPLSFASMDLIISFAPCWFHLVSPFLVLCHYLCNSLQSSKFVIFDFIYKVPKFQMWPIHKFFSKWCWMIVKMHHTMEIQYSKYYKNSILHPSFSILNYFN